MFDKIQELTNRAEEAAERASKGSRGSYQSCNEEGETAAHQPHQAAAAASARQSVPILPLSAANLRAQNSRSLSPQAYQKPSTGPPQQSAQPNAATNEVGLWLLTHDIPLKTSEFHLSNYEGLAIGDILEIGFGTPEAEAVTISRFGSIHLVSETRHAHPRGSAVRRLVEGTGARYQSDQPNANQQQRAPQRAASSIANASPSSIGQDLDGWGSHGSWSPRERAHQKERYRRKQKASRLQQLHSIAPAQPNMIVPVKQPDKIELDHWPTLPMLRTYLQATYAAWRVLTGGGRPC